ncbi:MAG: ABC transporter ATP-binding protein [Lachnospiraceae bacterium]|nr:ABC transporter ATP-binding protein [Lachnospiraceae bacterium]
MQKIKKRPEISVSLNKVSVRYQTGDFRNGGFKDYIIQKVRGKYKVNEFWVMDGIDFRLERGDLMGILGRNGAGKSTLLKTVAGIISPTGGSLNIEGSITALLGLGLGFDAELTVKENTFLLGALFGYRREFVKKMYDEIINFAELAEFQNRPFHQLSSGMKSRLAFSVACLAQPDILLLDEVLAVGDRSFQKKSEVKLQEIMSSGVTTLFVSHSHEQIRNICNKALWLEKGKQMAFGEVNEVCDMYEAFLREKI